MIAEKSDESEESFFVENENPLEKNVLSLHLQIHSISPNLILFPSNTLSHTLSLFLPLSYMLSLSHTHIISISLSLSAKHNLSPT